MKLKLNTNIHQSTVTTTFCAVSTASILWLLSNSLKETLFGFNPLEPRNNCSATSNSIKLVHWPLMGGLLHLVQQGWDWAGPQPAQTPPRCTKCNSPPINGQYTMSGLLHLAQWGWDWAGPQPAQAPPRCTKCNSRVACNALPLPVRRRWSLSNYRVFQKKSSALKHLGIFSLWLSLFKWHFANLLAIHIHTYLPIFVHLS